MEMIRKNIGEKTYFWKYLENNKIEIPIIQRDYAQGRIGKEALRESFLNSLLSYLNYENEDERQELKLDFVYGSKPNDSILPLDGQQRLTTLWLFHWFIAYKTNNVLKDEKIRKIFKHFTYETRDSSRDFCSELIDFGAKSSGQDSITNLIKSNLWFYNDWNCDPTIVSMMNMIDTMESVIKVDNFTKIWNRLSTDICPIVFYNITLESFGLTDDLYIKMNARGKPLTNFENFKADLVNYLKEKDNDYGEKISLLLDTTWTDLFWKRHSSKYEIDEIYFSFMNRLFFNLLITAKRKIKDKIEYIFNANDFERKYFIEDNLFKEERLRDEGNKFNLYGKSSDDRRISYSCFNGYAEILDFYNGDFESIEKTLNNLCKSNISDFSIFLPLWNKESDFCFIPKYKIDDETKCEIDIYDYSNNKIKDISILDQMERPIFYAICKYFEYGVYEKESFEEWIRFVWNLCSDSRLRSISYMVTAIRKIESCSKNSHSIYTYLKKQIDSNSLNSENKNVVEEQFEEECYKAKQIIEHPEFKDKILKAECIAFFDGTIRFLYRGGWDSFNTRLSNAKELFTKEGICEKYKVSLCKGFIRSLTDWEQLYNEFLFDSSARNWRKMLIESDKYKSPVDRVLSEKIENLQNISLSNTFEYKWDIQKKIWEDLSKSNLIQFLVNEHPDYRLHWLDKLAFYRERSFYDPIVIDWGNFKRTELLNLLEKESIISVKKQHHIPKCSYYIGENIDFVFSYNKKQYNIQWYLNNGNQNYGDIYLMDEEGDDYLSRPSHPGKQRQDDHKEYYCFDIDENMYTNSDLFITALKKLINSIS